jgi:hypothetical protein
VERKWQQYQRKQANRSKVPSSSSSTQPSAPRPSNTNVTNDPPNSSGAIPSSTSHISAPSASPSTYRHDASQYPTVRGLKERVSIAREPPTPPPHPSSSSSSAAAAVPAGTSKGASFRSTSSTYFGSPADGGNATDRSHRSHQPFVGRPSPTSATSTTNVNGGDASTDAPQSRSSMPHQPHTARPAYPPHSSSSSISSRYSSHSSQSTWGDEQRLSRLSVKELRIELRSHGVAATEALVIFSSSPFLLLLVVVFNPVGWLVNVNETT